MEQPSYGEAHFKMCTTHIRGAFTEEVMKQFKNTNGYADV